MILTAERYDSVPAVDLLREVELGRVGFDHRVIRSLDARRDETLAALARFAQEEESPDRLVELAEQVFDLYRHFRAPEAAAFYTSLLRRNPSEVPDALIEAFAELGSAGVEPLLKLHEEMGPEDAADVVFVLAALRVRDERILKLLLKTLAADPYEGALCLGLYGDPAAIPDIEKAAEALGPKQAEERKALLEAVEQLRRHVETGPLDTHFDIWALYPEVSTPLFGAMTELEALEFLDCDVPEYRAEVALSFCDEGYPDEVRDRLMVQALADEEPAVRACCLRALGERESEPAVRELLTAALTDTSRASLERGGALVSLARPDADPRIHEAIVRFYEATETRAASLEAMWRSLDTRYARFFELHAEDADTELRRRAIQGIGAFNLSKHAHLLVPALADDELREEALFAYALAMPGKTTPKSVHSLLQTIDDHAHGLTTSETEVVEFALDRRLEREGLDPVFHPEETEDAPEHVPAKSDKVGRNDPCPCGSGKKYKKCCGAAV